ncbi:MAG: thioredoxin [Victivallales bacterium]|nr:thioredoxin [Victivallales bacterium]
MKKISALTIFFLTAFALFSLTAKETANKENTDSENIIHITSEKQFNDEIKGSLCLVDFYADWCPPCKMLAPIIEKIADKYSGKIKVIKVNVDKNRGLSNKYGIRGIPSVKIFKNKKLIKSITGYKKEKVYTEVLDEVLNKR